MKCSSENRDITVKLFSITAISRFMRKVILLVIPDFFDFQVLFVRTSV
jgi:hypothetical protein